VPCMFFVFIQTVPCVFIFPTQNMPRNCNTAKRAPPLDEDREEYDMAVHPCRRCKYMTEVCYVPF